MKPILLLALFAACAPSFPAVKPTPGGTLLEIANVPEGLNCYPVRGYLNERGELCVSRLHSALDTMMGKMLDRHLTPNSYRARLELENVALTTAPDNPRRYDTRSVSYHFTLGDGHGRTLVDVRDTLAQAVSPIYHGLALPIPEEMLQAPELYQPGVLYQLFFDMVGDLAKKIDATPHPI